MTKWNIPFDPVEDQLLTDLENVFGKKMIYNTGKDQVDSLVNSMEDQE